MVFPVENVLFRCVFNEFPFFQKIGQANRGRHISDITPGHLGKKDMSYNVIKKNGEEFNRIYSPLRLRSIFCIIYNQQETQTQTELSVK